MTVRPRVRVLTRVCFAVLLVGAAMALVAPAARGDDAKAAAARQKQAARLLADGEYVKALAVIDEGLALAPGRLQLLQLRGRTLFEMRDFEGALVAYERLLAAGPRGANKRAAQRIIGNLQAVRTTKLELVIEGASADRPASVYLDTKSLGVFCEAAPRCSRGMLPGEYKLIVEQPGFQKLTERVTIDEGKTLTVERALTEEPSAVTVNVAAASGGTAPSVTVVIDGKELGAAPQSLTVDAGDHTLELRAAGHATERQTFAAHRGQPVALAVTMRKLVPVAVNVADAEVLLGDTPVPREADALVLPEGAVALVVRAEGFRPATVEVPAERPDGFRLDVELQPAPAPLSIEGAPRGAVVTIDGRVAGTVPLASPIDVDQGEHTITVTAPRRAPFRTRVEVDSAKPLRLEVTAMPSTSRRWVWVAAAGTGAALISTAAFGTLALGKESAFDDRAGDAGVTPMDPTLTSAADAGNRYARIADVSLVLTAVGAGALTWLYLKEGKAESRGTIAPVIAPGAVGVAGSF